MALENWLIDLAKDLESQEVLEWVFDYILRNSNSVMPTAVLASVATGFPDKLGKAALPLLRTPTLYDLDLWRRQSLEDLIVRLQFSELRDETLATLDELRVEAHDYENWRFRFSRIDSRTWKAVEDRANKRILFEPRELEPDLRKAQQEAQAQLRLQNRFSTLYLWSGQTLEQNPRSVSTIQLGGRRSPKQKRFMRRSILEWRVMQGLWILGASLRRLQCFYEITRVSWLRLTQLGALS
jgi:hypothetical protein